MRPLAIAALILCIVACTGTPPGAPSRPCVASGSPEGTVCGFYTRVLEMHPSGLPTPEQQAALAPWLSERLEARMTAARSVQDEFRTRHPNEKPPLVDGSLFASLFEGPTAFTVGRTAAQGDETRVPVRFRYGTEAEWQDVVILRREGDAFVIDDIEFAGAGPFNPAGRLSDRLERAGE